MAANNTLLDSLLAELDKTAGAVVEVKEEVKPVEKVAEEKKEEKKEEAKVEEKKEDKKEDEKKAEAKPVINEKLAALMSKLTDEQLDKIAEAAEKQAEAEKVAELAKQAEELETQGRFMYHGFAKEQIKVAFALGQMTEEDVVKVASALNWSVDEIFKGAAELPGEGSEQAMKTTGTDGGPAKDTISADGTIKPAAKAPGQTERKPEGAGELGQLKSIINDVKAVRREAANLDYNDNH